MDRVQTDLDQKLAAVLAHTVKVPAASHWPRLGAFKEPFAEHRVARSVAFGYQHIHAPADEFHAGIAEQLFHLGIHHHDDSSRVHHDHRIGRGFHGYPEHHFSVVAFGDIARHDRYAKYVALGALDGRERKRHEELLSVLAPPRRFEGMDPFT